jgi:hypothetical protein
MGVVVDGMKGWLLDLVFARLRMGKCDEAKPW